MKQKQEILLSYYGDDFTGATDVMEVLQWAGLRTVLFLSPPEPEQLARFEHLRAFGVAGWSRTMSVEEMDEELARAFRALRDCDAPIVHYKICSTFDSSPQIGNIGKALELGCEVFDAGTVPVLVGAPALGRYQVFGNLFARSGLDTEPYRLDRHPTMSQHPTTPMDESDLRMHLERQTGMSVDLVDVLQLDRWVNEPTDVRLPEEAAAVLIDVLREEHLPLIGRLIAEAGSERRMFTVGSSGVEYALGAYWEASGQLELLRSHAAQRPKVERTSQMVVVTGSCSPVNDRQIGWALENGFVDVPLNPARLINPETSEAEIALSVQRGLKLASTGANVILHSSRGPEDARVAETLAQYRSMGFSDEEIKLKNGRTLGPKLGRILGGILEKHPLKRVGVAGGDTSGYVARELGIEALEAIAPVAPGSPLCRVYASNELDGVEVIFKGGQVGKGDVWGAVFGGE